MLNGYRETPTFLGIAAKRSSVQIRKSYSVVSFFSGCGGLDLGFMGGFEYKGERLKKLPFNICAAYDHDEKCTFTYQQNIGQHAETCDLAEADPLGMPKADMLIGGFPCQDFSSCGPKAGLSSKRGRLYLTLIQYMQTHRPKVVIAENVPHLASMGGGVVLDTIVKDLRGAGYKFEVWQTALRKALDFIAKAPGLPPPDKDLKVLLILATAGRTLTAGDKMLLNTALEFISVKMVLV